MKRYAKLAESIANFSEDSATKAELEEVSKICCALAERPPKTFHEVVQSIWFLFVVLQME